MNDYLEYTCIGAKRALGDAYDSLRVALESAGDLTADQLELAEEACAAIKKELAHVRSVKQDIESIERLKSEPRQGLERLSEAECDNLIFIRQRLVNVYGESPNVDYVHNFSATVDKILKNQRRLLATEAEL
jgi:hypothetical protein